MHLEPHASKYLLALNPTTTHAAGETTPTRRLHVVQPVGGQQTGCYRCMTCGVIADLNELSMSVCDPERQKKLQELAPRSQYNARSMMLCMHVCLDMIVQSYTSQERLRSIMRDLEDAKRRRFYEPPQKDEPAKLGPSNWYCMTSVHCRIIARVYKLAWPLNCTSTIPNLRH